MELEKLTALQLGGKNKTASGQRPGWSKKLFSHRSRNRIQKYTLILTHIREEAITNVQKKYKKASKDGTYTSPLAGVPIAIKDNICINGK